MTIKKTRVNHLIKAGSKIAGESLSTIAAVMIGGVVGGPAGAAVGALVGSTFSVVAEEVANKALSQREEVRIGAVLAFSAEKIQINLNNKLQPRTDGFFQSKPGERSSGEEIFEATLLSSQREHEERKLKYFGNLMAHLAFNETFDRSQANFLVKLAKDLTWHQLCILAIAAKKDSFGLKSGDYRGTSISDHNLIFVLTEIQYLYSLGIINFQGNASIDISDANPSKMTPQGVGAHMCNGMELKEIPLEELQPIIDLLK